MDHRALTPPARARDQVARLGGLGRDLRSTATTTDSQRGSGRPAADRRHLPHAAIPDDPFTHLDVREKLGLRAGGFGLLICQGMVDEMAYNDKGNEVTLIKRFTGGGAAALDPGGPDLHAPAPGKDAN